MSLEIREMILRTTLIDDIPDKGKEKQGGKEHETAVNTEYIIAECMERIMERIKEENER